MGEDTITSTGTLYMQRDSQWTTATLITGTSCPSFTATTTEDTDYESKNYTLAPTNISLTIEIPPLISDIEIIVPNKVMVVTISDNHQICGFQPGKYKQVVKEPDEFSLEFGCALALAKSYYGKEYTLEGLEEKAHEFLIRKKYVKIINQAIKQYKQKIKDKEKTELEEKERKAIIERRKAKNKKRREKMKARKKQEEINTIAEAIRKSKE